MDREDVWRGIDQQRRELVDLLEDLSAQEWRQPSLCRGWTVRQVILLTGRDAALSDLSGPGAAALSRALLIHPLRRPRKNDQWYSALFNFPASTATMARKPRNQRSELPAIARGPGLMRSSNRAAMVLAGQTWRAL